MANEATLVFQSGIPIPFTCDNATGIEKGTLLTLSDPMTAAATGAGVSGGAVAGICAAEKIASDGNTKVSVFRQGIFKVYASGVVAAGDPLVMWGNFVSTAAVNVENVFGVSLETATNGETILVDLRPTSMQLA